MAKVRGEWGRGSDSPLKSKPFTAKVKVKGAIILREVYTGCSSHFF